MMDLQWKQCEAMEAPSDSVDCISSPTTVYFFKDIKKIDKKDADGNTYTAYEYMMAKYPKDKYINALREEQEITNAALQELILSMS